MQLCSQMCTAQALNVAYVLVSIYCITYGIRQSIDSIPSGKPAECSLLFPIYSLQYYFNQTSAYVFLSNSHKGKTAVLFQCLNTALIYWMVDIISMTYRHAVPPAITMPCYATLWGASPPHEHYLEVCLSRKFVLGVTIHLLQDLQG